MDMALLRVYFNEADHHQGHPLSDHLVDQARLSGLAGATILRGVMGYGGRHPVHTATLLRLTERLPLVLEVVETRDRLLDFVNHLGPALAPTLVTLERVEVLHRPQGDKV